MPELPENQYVSPFHRAPKRATSPEGPSGRTSVQFKANSKAAARRTSPADIFDFSKRRNSRNTQIDRGTDHGNAKTSEDLRRPPVPMSAHAGFPGQRAYSRELRRPWRILLRLHLMLRHPLPSGHGLAELYPAWARWQQRSRCQQRCLQRSSASRTPAALGLGATPLARSAAQTTLWKAPSRSWTPAHSYQPRSDAPDSLHLFARSAGVKAPNPCPFMLSMSDRNRIRSSRQGVHSVGIIKTACTISP